MANEVWIDEEKKFLDVIKSVKIPNATLEGVANITPKQIDDLNEIPNGGGCYWIWTNEPVVHSMHKNKIPNPFDGGQVIYNGIAKDDVRSRVKHHLFGLEDAGWSGISLDIYFGQTQSHRKKIFASNGKVPYIQRTKIAKRSSKKSGITKGTEIKYYQAIRGKEDLAGLNLSETERQFVIENQEDRIFFRNGINITEGKHLDFDYRAYYITGLSTLYLEFIEKKWREQYGLPRLCSYSSGR